MYARQCLGKSRIPDIQSLKKKTKAWVNYINRGDAKINWKFTREDARDKFSYV
jgi:hypothetical protein